MIFLKIYIAFSLLTFCLLWMQSYLVGRKLKRKYPLETKELKRKIKKERGVVGTIFSYVRSLICSFVPVINIALFYTALFKEEKVERKAIAELRKCRGNENETLDR